MNHFEWDLDPIFLTKLENPYLASDGITYSKASIQQAMCADPWHRSPVTGEVLRPLCYRNTLIAQLLEEENEEDESPLRLYDSKGKIPENGGIITWTLPSLCTPRIAALKMKWDLEGQDTLTLTAHVLRDAASQDWLMHPPPAEEMWSDCMELAQVFNVHKSVPNPWCITHATFADGTTVEDKWLLAN